MVSQENVRGGRRPPVIVMRIANRVVRPLLRSPAHGLASRRLLLLEYTGRRTGTRYTFPVAYAETGPDTVLTSSLGSGWPSRIAGRPVRLRLHGRWRDAVPTVLDDPEAVRGELAGLIARRGPAAVAPLRLGLPTDRPAGADELRAAAAGVRLVRFRLPA